MPRLAWYAWYPADYRADTRRLTREQHFAYREILDEIFLAGQHEDPPSIPDDDAALADLCMCSAEEWQSIRAVLIDGPRPFLVSENGRIHQKRASEEISKAKGRSEHAYKAASARWSDQKPKRVRNSGNGNGRGHGQMSEAQRVFFTSKAGKWLEENRELYVGGQNDTSFQAAFAQAVGISWKDYQRISKQTSN